MYMHGYIFTYTCIHAYIYVYMVLFVLCPSIRFHQEHPSGQGIGTRMPGVHVSIDVSDGCMVASVGRAVRRSHGQSVGRLDSRLVGRSDRRSDRRMVGRSVDRLVGPSVALSKEMQLWN